MTSHYGLDWPDGVQLPFIDLILAKKWREEPFCHGNLLDPGEHMLRAIRALFTPDQWKISPWTEEHAHAWAEEDFSIWLGSASSGKAQPLDELIATPTGPRAMGDLVPGDKVLRPDGTGISVTKVHDAGVKEVHQVSTRDGRSTRCAGDHLWSVAGRGILPTTRMRPGDMLPPTKFHLAVPLCAIRPTGRSVPMRCITVDSPDGLYLTAQLLPTHNSNDAGGLAVLDWITDPTETYIAMASTSVPMLKMRSFESVLRYFRYLKAHASFAIPGKEATSQTAIVNETDTDPGANATHKASIRGVAVADGNPDNAVARLAGAHLPYVTLILDEGAALPRAASDARINMMAGTRRFRFLSLANPIDKSDEATRFCAPLGGWRTVTPETGKWRSEYGLVLHHNGELSPGIHQPQEFPFLLKQTEIDAILKQVAGNRGDPIYQRMVVGFPPKDGTVPSVLTMREIEAFLMSAAPEWGVTPPVRVAGLDPAFTSDGDAAILQMADVGFSARHIWQCAFLEPIRIPIDNSLPRPAIYQVSDFVRQASRDWGFRINNLAVDESGTQSVGGVIGEESGVRPILVSFGAKATITMPAPTAASGGRKPPPQPKYANMVTQMWYEVKYAGAEGRIRNLPEAVAQQMCDRRYKRRAVPTQLETKAEYKARTGKGSPDEADAASLCFFAASKLRTPDPQPESINSIVAGIQGASQPGTLADPMAGGGYSGNALDNLPSNYAGT